MDIKAEKIEVFLISMVNKWDESFRPNRRHTAAEALTTFLPRAYVHDKKSERLLRVLAKEDPTAALALRQLNSPLLIAPSAMQLMREQLMNTPAFMSRSASSRSSTKKGPMTMAREVKHELLRARLLGLWNKPEGHKSLLGEVVQSLQFRALVDDAVLSSLYTKAGNPHHANLNAAVQWLGENLKKLRACGNPLCRGKERLFIANQKQRTYCTPECFASVRSKTAERARQERNAGKVVPSRYGPKSPAGKLRIAAGQKRRRADELKKKEAQSVVEPHRRER